MSQDTIPTHSWRLLSGIFILALLVFTAIRWDYSAWMSQHIQQAVKHAGYTIRYQDMHLSGTSLNLSQVHIQNQQHSIALDTLHISPAFSRLLTGELAANISLSWQNNPISFTLAQHQDELTFTDIDAVVDVSRIKNLNIPAKLAGVVRVTGELSLNPDTGLPKHGALHITWNGAMAGLATPEFTLGDYQADIHSTDDEKQPWLWQVTGGSGVSLNGSGTVLPHVADPKQWLVNGLVEIQIDNSNPSLAMMMQSMMGSQQAKLRISGSLGAPRTDMVR